MIKLLLLDIDGVLTDGTKEYDRNHNVLSKKFLCKDFTAIKRIIASGIKVIMISGDEWNRTMAEKRNIDFYCSRDENLSLDKSLHLPKISQKYNVEIENMAFVGDDYFDLSMFERLKYTFCPSDAPQIIKQKAYKSFSSRGGQGVIVELHDYLINNNWIKEALPEDVAVLDRHETTSKEMK